VSKNGRLEKAASGLKRWESETLAKSLNGGGGEREVDFSTSVGPTKRLYTPLDVADLDYERDVGYPGEYPYTRGVQSTMYRGRLWTMRKYAGYGSAEETNQRFRFRSAHAVRLRLGPPVGAGRSGPGGSGHRLSP
jgi:methylmalonyl-CoA mutase N-terminal domain/subunit